MIRKRQIIAQRYAWLHSFGNGTAPDECMDRRSCVDMRLQIQPNIFCFFPEKVLQKKTQITLLQLSTHEHEKLFLFFGKCPKGKTCCSFFQYFFRNLKTANNPEGFTVLLQTQIGASNVKSCCRRKKDFWIKREMQSRRCIVKTFPLNCIFTQPQERCL